MIFHATSRETTSATSPQTPAIGTRPVTLPLLALSVPLIAVVAVAFCTLVAVVSILVLYARIGQEGVTDFYQDLRFDIPLQTQLYAALMSTLYIGVACTTIGAAVLRGRKNWPALVGLTPIGGDRRVIGLLIVATLSYAAIISLSQDHRVVISGRTNLVLLGTFAANLLILAPCAEELLFRGWLYTGLRHRLPFWPSFLVTTSLFAAIHWDANHRRILLVLPLAIALGLLREATGSIKPTILLHGVYNLVIVAIALLET